MKIQILQGFNVKTGYTAVFFASETYEEVKRFRKEGKDKDPQYYNGQQQI